MRPAGKAEEEEHSSTLIHTNRKRAKMHVRCTAKDFAADLTRKHRPDADDDCRSQRENQQYEANQCNSVVSLKHADTHQCKRSCHRCHREPKQNLTLRIRRRHNCKYRRENCNVETSASQNQPTPPPAREYFDLCVGLLRRSRRLIGVRLHEFANRRRRISART